MYDMQDIFKQHEGILGANRTGNKTLELYTLTPANTCQHSARTVTESDGILGILGNFVTSGTVSRNWY